jgi:hypothetical protein
VVESEWVAREGGGGGGRMSGGRMIQKVLQPSALLETHVVKETFDTLGPRYGWKLDICVATGEFAGDHLSSSIHSI